MRIERSVLRSQMYLFNGWILNSFCNESLKREGAVFDTTLPVDQAVSNVLGDGGRREITEQEMRVADKRLENWISFLAKGTYYRSNTTSIQDNAGNNDVDRDDVNPDAVRLHFPSLEDPDQTRRRYLAQAAAYRSLRASIDALWPLLARLNSHENPPRVPSPIGGETTHVPSRSHVANADTPDIPSDMASLRSGVDQLIGQSDGLGYPLVAARRVRSGLFRTRDRLSRSIEVAVHGVA